MLNEQSDMEKEEGEIEDGEIVDSQDEGDEATTKDTEGGATWNESGAAAAAEAKATNGAMPSNVYIVYATDAERMGLFNNRGKKKKKKKKKKSLGLPLEDESEPGADADGSTTTKAPKPKKQRVRYIDHDKVNDDPGKDIGDNRPWFNPALGPFPRGPWQENVPYDMPKCMSPSPLPPPPEYDGSPFGRSPPKRRRSRSPPGLYDSPYESTDEEDRAPPPFGGGIGTGGGGGCGGKGRGPIRPMDKRNPRGNNKRGRGGKKKRDFKRGKRGRGGNHAKKPLPTCRFYMDGKCSKGDECVFKHDGTPPKKPDLCKFYLNGFCGKGENCLYLHGEFPCKFFHTGAKCYSEGNCRFSHAALTDDTRKLLERCLDKDDEDLLNDMPAMPPKSFRPSLLGSPPRHIKEMTAQEAVKKIPSLFDIQVDIPPSMALGRHGSPSQEPMEEEEDEDGDDNEEGGGGEEDPQMGAIGGGPGFYTETMSPPMQGRVPLLPLPPFGGLQGSCYGFDQQQQQQFTSMMSAATGGMQMATPESAMFMSGLDDQSMVVGNDMSDMDHSTFSSCGTKDQDGRSRTAMMQQEHNGGEGDQGFKVIPWRSLAVLDVDAAESGDDSREKERSLVVDEDQRRASEDHERSQSSESESDSSTAAKRAESGAGGKSSSILIPIHLPKKQRELFLRIQQQQREARNVGQQHLAKDAKKLQQLQQGEGSDAAKSEGAGESETDEPVADQEDAGTPADEDLTKVKRTPRYDDDNVDEVEEKEKWYSSDDDDDDEDQPLTAVLKKLQQQPIANVVAVPETPAPNAAAVASQHLPPALAFDIAKMLQSITGQTPHGILMNSSATTTPPQDPRQKQASVGATDLSRDPRAQRHAVDRRDPRSARSSNIVAETRDPRSKLPSLRDPRQQHSSAASGGARKDVVRYRPEPSVAAKVATAPAAKVIDRDVILLRSPEQKSSSLEMPAYHPIPYRLHTVTTSHPNYGNLATRIDSKLLQNDPRLKKQLASTTTTDLRMSRKLTTATPAVLSVADQRRTLKENHAFDKLKDSATAQPATDNERAGGGTGHRLGHHRLGAATMPGPLHGVSASKQPPPPPPTAPGALGDKGDDDCIVLDADSGEKKVGPIRIAREVTSDGSPAGSGSPKSTWLIKKPLPKGDSEESSRDSSTPPLALPKKPAKIKGGSYQRKSSMDYASPLGYDNDDVVGGEASSYSSYNRRPQGRALMNANTNGPAVHGSPAIPKTSLEPPCSLSPPPLPLEVDMDTAVVDNTSIKDIFKTIDPTASPFC